MTFGKKLRRLLTLQGMTSYELAKTIGCAPSTITRVILGLRCPSLETAQRIAKALRSPNLLECPVKEPQ